MILGISCLLTGAMRCHRAQLIQQYTDVDSINTSVAEPVVGPGGCQIKVNLILFVFCAAPISLCKRSVTKRTL
jgi:hypothetical protein